MKNSDGAGLRDNLDSVAQRTVPPPPRATASAGRPLGVAVATTALVTALSYAVPDAHAASAVGLAFLAVTYFLTLHRPEPEAAAHFGLSLGGLFDPAPIDAKRLVTTALRELAFVLLVAAVVFPPFWLGYLAWFAPRGHFHAAPPWTVLQDALGQYLVIALPEEAFYRGYLQTSLDEAWPPRWSLFGARLGPALLVTSVVFALGHVATEFHPNRLAVFFPSLLFGLIRTRRGSVGTSAAFHALCNLFSAYLARSYGLLG